MTSIEPRPTLSRSAASRRGLVRDTLGLMTIVAAGGWWRMVAAAGSRPPLQRRVADSRELAEALDDSIPGSEIVLADGVYAGELTLRNAGTAAAPIVLRPEHAAGACVRGSLRLAGAHGIVAGLCFEGGQVAIEGDDCRVTRCWFAGSTGAAIRIVAPSRRAEVDHNEIRRFEHRGISGEAGRHAHPSRPHIHHNRLVDQVSERGGGIIMGERRAHTAHRFAALVERNLVQRFNGIEPISAKSSGNVFRFNTVEDADGLIMCRHGYDNDYIGNTSINAGGIFLHGKRNRAIGNHHDGRKSGRWRDHVAASGDISQDALRDGGEGGTHPFAEGCLFLGNTGVLRVGGGSARWTLPALHIRIARHQGPILLEQERDTVSQPQAAGPDAEPIPRHVTLTEMDVGPNAA